MQDWEHVPIASYTHTVGDKAGQVIKFLTLPQAIFWFNIQSS